MFLQMTLFPSFYWLGNISLLIPKASDSTAFPSGLSVILLFASALSLVPGITVHLPYMFLTNMSWRHWAGST